MDSKEMYNTVTHTSKKWKDVIDFIASMQKEDEDAIKILSIIGAKEPINRLNKNAGITLFKKLAFVLSPITISGGNDISPEYWASYYPIALYDIDRSYEAQSKEFSRLRKKVCMYAADFFNMSYDDFIAAFGEFRRNVRSAK